MALKGTDIVSFRFLNGREHRKVVEKCKQQLRLVWLEVAAGVRAGKRGPRPPSFFNLIIAVL